MSRYIFLWMLLLLWTNTSHAQNTVGFWELMKGRPVMKEGDKAYNNRNYVEAKEKYEEAAAQLGSPISVLMRKANTAYRTESWEEAKKQYKMILDQENISNQEGFWANYNQGNVALKEENWTEAINSYKSALKLKPSDPQAKYNLSYALMKKKQEDEENEDNSEDDNNEDDQEDENEDQGGEDQNKDQEKQEGKDEPQDSSPREHKSQLSQEQAERLLQALRAHEKELLDGKEEEGVGQKVLEKDW